MNHLGQIGFTLQALIIAAFFIYLLIAFRDEIKVPQDTKTLRRVMRTVCVVALAALAYSIIYRHGF